MKKCISSIIILVLMLATITGCGKTDSGTVSTDGWHGAGRDMEENV